MVNKLNKQIAKYLSTMNFVPKHSPVEESDVVNLKTFIKQCSKLLVLTGAGISTESGIPDYRSEAVGLYARSTYRPMQYRDFLESPANRNRYWARNFVGWPRFSQCQPNFTHFRLARLEKAAKLTGIVTQNVDGLHLKAGSENVLELHGTAHKVVCLSCSRAFARPQIQQQLRDLNPDLRENAAGMIRPDGDVEISQEFIDGFRAPFCEGCGGALKPDIVFFGDSVPKARVAAAKNMVSQSDAVLVLGSSLAVFSGFRIILQARDERKPICIINIGQTRADALASLKIAKKCGDVLAKINF